MSVHTRGRALPEDSGFDGFWGSQQRARIVSSQYFINMIAVGWAREGVALGKFQWKRADGRLPGEMAFPAGLAAPFAGAEDGNMSGCFCGCM